VRDRGFCERHGDNPFQRAKRILEIVGHDGAKIHRAHRRDEIHDRIGLKARRGAHLRLGKGPVDDAAVLMIGMGGYIGGRSLEKIANQVLAPKGRK
jgi:hypothetical protein